MNKTFITANRYFIALEDKIRSMFNICQPEDKVISDSVKYWNNDYSEKFTLSQDAHWRGKGIFEDEERWLKIGEENLDLISRYSGPLNLHFPVKQIVEWGCGGGANAIHFAPITEEFVGIDIAAESLKECEQQIARCGLNNFHPMLIEASRPESVLNDNRLCPDIFLCTYVYELLPSRAYGLRVLSIANKILKNDGVALIQVRYNDGRMDKYAIKCKYSRNPYNMTTYAIEEFWNHSISHGFEPIGVVLKPIQPLVNDQHYAYYILKKIHTIQ